MSTKRQPLKISTRKRKRPATSSASGVPSILNRIPVPLASTHQSTTATQETNDDFLDEDSSSSFELPSDIILAIASLNQRHSYATCELTNPDSEPIQFVLKLMLNATLFTSSNNAENDQIASSIASTGFDIELNRLCAAGEIKLIQLQGMNGEEDTAVFEMKDYLTGVGDVKMHQDRSDHDQKVIDLFTSCVKEFNGTFVAHRELQEAMEYKNRRNDEYLLNNDKWIDQLISAQLLLPRRRMGATSVSSAHASYWFVLPKLGHAASFITEGRRRMVMKLKRAPYRELKRNSLETSARGGMAGPFHVRDLLARGVARVKNTANGQFVKLVECD